MAEIATATAAVSGISRHEKIPLRDESMRAATGSGHEARRRDADEYQTLWKTQEVTAARRIGKTSASTVMTTNTAEGFSGRISPAKTGELASRQ